MKILILKFITCLVMLLSVAPVMYSQTQRGGWKEVVYQQDTPILNDSKNNEGIEIGCKDQNIILKTPKNIDVKIFTILGQPISQESLTPGTYQFKLGMRGIYIVKYGAYTIKIAL